MHTPSLDHVLKFVELLKQFRMVERTMFVRGGDRHENDGEHTFQLAMLAWYINETYDLKFDAGKLLKYALAHDLVEVYAGDTFLYDTDQSLHTSKHDRETAAAARLSDEFPEFLELHSIIAAYEERADAESAFIYALDKIEPVMSIYADNGKTWKSKRITLEMLESAKARKVAIDQTVDSLFRELIERLRNKENELFNENTQV